MLIQKYSADNVYCQTRKTSVSYRNILLQFFAAYAGAILTFHLQLLHQTAIASSAITTCLIWLLLLPAHKDKRYLILAVYCGSFAGMSSFCYDCTQSKASIYYQIAAFSFAAALSYIIIQLLSTHFPKSMLKGYGGRLGTIAFISSYLCSLMLSKGRDSVDLYEIIASPEILKNYIPYAIIACGGSITPFLLIRNKWNNIDEYFLTGLTAFLGLIGNFLFSIFFADLTLAPAAFYTGLFVSMTKSNLCSPRALAVAGGLSGLLMLYVLAVFSGIGGSLGLTAMLSVLCVTVFLLPAACRVQFLWRKPLAFSVIAGIVVGSCAASYFYPAVVQSAGAWKTEIVESRLP
jgi:hypothetical protein